MQLRSLAPLAEVSSSNSAPDVYDDGYLRVEHANYYVACAGETIKLSRKEFLLVSRLAQKIERIVPAEELWQHAWGARSSLNTESLHVHIYRLRRRLAPFGLKIETMVNVGYRLLPAARAQDKN